MARREYDVEIDLGTRKLKTKKNAKIVESHYMQVSQINNDENLQKKSLNAKSSEKCVYAKPRVLFFSPHSIYLIQFNFFWKLSSQSLSQWRVCSFDFDFFFEVRYEYGFLFSSSIKTKKLVFRGWPFFCFRLFHFTFKTAHLIFYFLLTKCERKGMEGAREQQKNEMKLADVVVVVALVVVVVVALPRMYEYSRYY